MSYIPEDYWLEHGKTYKKDFQYNKKYQLQEQTLIRYLETNIFHDISISSRVSVLEFGCGFGRITKLILSCFSDFIKEYVAVDISPHQIENAKDYLRSDGLIKEKYSSIVKFIVSDVQSFESKEKEKYYDLVLSCEMLMHIPPSKIQDVMSKLVNMSKTNVVNIDWYEKETPRKVASHNFVHQYENSYKSMPLVKEVYQTPIFKKGLFSDINIKQTIFLAIVHNVDV
jgi:cyclopropane fatty-acyl-phospholipid synthase-like methyltransferase